MATILSEATIEEIRARTDLADLIASYGIQVKRAGSSYKACCPFHHEKTPSFNIQPNKGFYHCFGCGESGDCFSFVMKQEGLSFMEAARKLAAGCGVTIEEKKADPKIALYKHLYAVNSEAALFFHRCLLKTKAAARARSYLANRDLSDEIVERFQLGYVPEGAEPILEWAKKHSFSEKDLEAVGLLRPPRYAGDSWYNPFGGRLAFSIRDRLGRTVAFSCRILEMDKAKMRGGKYVNTQETELFRKSNILYAYDLAASEIIKHPHREAIVCEGQIDVIRCHACGFKTAVASEGTAFTREHVDVLKKCADAVILLFDGDGAGQKASVRVGGEFLAAGMPVRVAALPSGEDPDSFLRAQGAEPLQACLDAAESVTAFQIRVLLAQEQNATPNVKMRIARAVFETIGLCPSAVLRASLLSEAAQLLALPIAALEQDFAQMQATLKVAPPQNNSDRIESTQKPSSLDAAKISTFQEDEAPEAYDPRPSYTPPSRNEWALCEFLFEHNGDADVMAGVKQYVPECVLDHAFTRLFVRTWCEAGNSAIFALRTGLEPGDQGCLDAIFATKEKCAMSEEPCETSFMMIASKLWADALGRIRSAMSVSDDAAIQKSLKLTMVLHKLKNGTIKVRQSVMVDPVVRAIMEEKK